MEYSKLQNRALMLMVFLVGGHYFYTATTAALHEQELLDEPDPLVVNYVEGDSNLSVCEDRKYSFRRVVRSSKAIDIHIQERWHNLDGIMDVNGVEGEIVSSKPLYYPLNAGWDKVMTFDKTVPENVFTGKWVYRPVATYKVNEKKTITRMLPIQYVNITCKGR